ncbi:MAG: Mov34/MPN/PAD-1 family protein [Methylomonas sp.]|nr:Mov34/MPN/PAD-1 family protein [Methylomonas sp.]
MTSRIFLLPDYRGRVLFDDRVLRHMYKYTQTRFWHCEAGGQLFSETPHESSVVVSVVSGPHLRDSRSRHNFVPDLTSATRDRQSQFSLGRHAVGLWHTHPEANPSPSNQDYETTWKYLEAFDGMMNGFLLVILGNYGNPFNMVVWMATTNKVDSWVKLTEA